MSHSDKVSELGPTLEAYLNLRKDELELRRVWYGDDDSIPETPAVLISPDNKSRELTNTGHTTLNTFNFVVTIFHSRFEDPETTRKECDALAEDVERVLHENKRLDGMLLHSYVRRMDFGVARRGRVVMKATRLLWEAQSQTRI